jgi:hypothetical protein
MQHDLIYLLLLAHADFLALSDLLRDEQLIELGVALDDRDGT